jgi:ATP-binding cassette subfamily F protein 3
MSVLALTNVALAYGGRDVLRGVSARLEAGDRVGLVGANGAGKTTLLRVIAGEEQPDAGAVALAAGCRLAYVPQLPDLSSTRTVREEVFSALAHLAVLERELEEAAHALAGATGEDIAAAAARYDALQRRFEAENAYAAHAEAEALLAHLRLPESLWDQPVNALSGGEKSRVALARALLSRPDVLLLDEPTNHLDITALTWLEGFLLRWSGALLIVSHDRVFLDAVATEIWELRGGVLTRYRGNYSAYAAQRAARDAYEREQYERQQTFIARERALIDRYRAGQRAKWAQGREKRLERLETLAAPLPEQTARIRLRQAGRTSAIVLTLERLVIARPGGGPLLRFPEHVEVGRGARVAIVGPNGAGKTTLLRTLLGEHTPAAGQVLWGANARPGYYRQGTEHLNDQRTVLEEMLAAAPLSVQAARDLLARFLFRGDAVEQLVGSLSGGERSRLALARLAATEVNALLLDEPTNHLDIAAREALEEVLREYDGTLLLVTHDRALITRLATHTWLLADGVVHVREGARYDPPVEALPAPRPERPRQAAPSSGRLIEERRREVARLEAEIAVCEQQIATLTTAIDAAGAAGDAARVGELGSAYAAAESALMGLLAAWERAASALDEAVAQSTGTS